MNNVIISPSILSADFSNLEREIRKIETAGAEWVHIDVMDGHFVPNISIGIPVVKSIRPVTKLMLDVHLMITDPDKYIEPFANAGADIITVHYEATGDDTSEILSKIHSLGLKSGLSIKPKTSIEQIKQYILQTDLVLVMTVEPGFSGQVFMKDCAKKLEEIKPYLRDDQYLQVDGGINAETGRYCVDLGANSLVAGNFIFKSDDINESIRLLRS